MKGNRSDGIATKPHQIDGSRGAARRRKRYLKPEIISFSAEEILARLGSARACSFSGGITCNGPAGEFGPPVDR